MIKMNLGYIIYRDLQYGHWIVQCLEFDIVAQGSTKQEAIDSLEKTILSQIHLDVKSGRDPLQHIDKPPVEISEIEIVYEPPLLPCPFCGEDAKFVLRDEFGDDTEFDVECGTDKCFLKNGADWWLPKAKAIKMWNKRAGND